MSNGADDLRIPQGAMEEASTTRPLPRPLARLDAFQQQHRSVAVPLAVYKKFSDDDAGKLASLVSYYAFLSVFPLLIVLATILSRLLAGHPEVATEIVTTAAGSFLSIGSTGTVAPLDVSGLALVVAVVIGLWSGLAVANAMQDAMNTVYEVPKTERGGVVGRVLRSLSLLAIVGVGLPTTAVIQGLAFRAIPGPIPAVAIVVAAMVVNSALIALAFRRSTAAETTWRTVLPGAVIAAIAWSLMQALATSLLTQKVGGAESDYGPFAIVIGLLFWFFLLAQVTIYCAELNVVLAYGLWPRSLKSIARGQAETEADVRAYSHYPMREQQATNMEVTVALAHDDEGAAPTDSTGRPSKSEGTDTPMGTDAPM